jgi:hypothetical protein
MRYAIAAVVVTAALISIFTALLIDTPAPAKVLSVHDRAAWGIGEDGTRITPQPETIRINLK